MRFRPPRDPLQVLQHHVVQAVRNIASSSLRVRGENRLVDSHMPVRAETVKPRVRIRIVRSPRVRSVSHPQGPRDRIQRACDPVCLLALPTEAENHQRGIGGEQG